MIDHLPAGANGFQGNGPSIGPYERVLWANRYSVLGRFDAEPDVPDFSEAGAIGASPAIAFPQTAIRIEPEGEESFISDPTMAVLHNPLRPYRRRDVVGAGDHCEWISVAPETLRAVTPWLARRDAPFPRSSAPMAPRTYALMRLLVRYLRTAEEPDEGLVQRLLFDIVFRVVRGLSQAPAEVAVTPRAHERHNDLVDEVKNLLVTRFAEAWTVESIAERVGSSPFHLSRIFRDRTGYTLHRYLTELRLRESLSRLEDPGADLTDIALDIGFCSHSHFTVSFGQTFGMPPSDFRKRADARQVRHLRRRLMG